MTAEKPGTPDCAIVGTSGSRLRSRRTRHRQRPQRAGAHVLEHRQDRQEHHRHMATEKVGHGWAIALVGDARDLDSGDVGEQFGGDVSHRAGHEGIVDPARLSLGERDQLRDGTDRKRRMHHQHARQPGNQADRGKILARIVSRIGIEGRIDGERSRIGKQDGVTVGARSLRPPASRWFRRRHRGCPPRSAGRSTCSSCPRPCAPARHCRRRAGTE